MDAECTTRICALTSTAVLCAQVRHSRGVSPVAKPAQKCASFPSSQWWFLTPKTQHQISNSYQSSSPRLNDTGYPQSHQHLTGTHPHSFMCCESLPLCSAVISLQHRQAVWGSQVFILMDWTCSCAVGDGNQHPLLGWQGKLTKFSLSQAGAPDSCWYHVHHHRLLYLPCTQLEAAIVI